jgi:ABC-type glutathione transport system ATPase component
MSGVLITVKLRAHYGETAVLHDVSFELHRGEILGLVGSSGAGKSTLVLALLGLLPWRNGSVSGEVVFENKNLLAAHDRELRELRGRKIALVPQSPMSALNPAISLDRHFREAWNAHAPRGSDGLRDRLKTLLPEVSLPFGADFLSRRPGQISVGQAQRVLIAMALLHRPSLIIADEPTSALDPVTQMQIVDLLSEMNRRHSTALLYVSHDLASVIRLAHRIAVLDDGRIVEDLPVFSFGGAHHETTRALIRALPVPPEVILQFRFRGAQE